jgi:GNAT superfamily N-acetyltransferase
MSNNNIFIRRIKKDDLGDIFELLKTRDNVDLESAKKRLEILYWLAFKNPLSNGQSTYFLAQDGHKIIAHIGLMPVKFFIKGRYTVGYFVHDVYVIPEYRSKGLGLYISVKLYKAIEKHSDSFCCLIWTNELNRKIQKSRGYYELSANRYYKFLNPYYKFQKIIKNKFLCAFLSFFLQIFFRSIDFINNFVFYSNLKVKQTSTFDNRFDNMDFSPQHKFPISIINTRPYLNWRFTEKPYSNMVVFFTQKNQIIKSFIIVSLITKDDKVEGVIAHLMVDPDDTRTISSLIMASIKYFRSNHAHCIRCCLTDRRLVKIFKKHLFFKDIKKQEPVMLANLDKTENMDLLIDIENWHLTYGASDELMFNIINNK